MVFAFSKPSYSRVSFSTVTDRRQNYLSVWFVRQLFGLQLYASSEYDGTILPAVAEDALVPTTFASVTASGISIIFIFHFLFLFFFALRCIAYNEDRLLFYRGLYRSCQLTVDVRSTVHGTHALYCRFCNNQRSGLNCVMSTLCDIVLR